MPMRHRAARAATFTQVRQCQCRRWGTPAPNARSGRRWTMPFHIPESSVIYAFDRGATPVAEIEAGDEVIFATLDPSSGFIRSHEDIARFAEGRRADRVNPATGPVWIHGAEPGDEIRVHILDIQLRSPGWVRMPDTMGVLRGEVDTSRSLMATVRGDRLVTHL